MTRQLPAFILLAAGAAVLWWRAKQQSEADGSPLSDALVDQYKSIVSGLEPAQINERTQMDGIPDAANALMASGLAGYVTGAEGTVILTTPGQLNSAITASKTPILPAAPAAPKESKSYRYAPPGMMPFWSEKKLGWPIIGTRDLSP